MVGRPPIGKVAMTTAERVRRHRLKHGISQPVTKSPTPVTKQAAPDPAAVASKLAQADARIRELEAELARERAAIAELKAQAARGKHRETAEAKPAAPSTDAERTIKGLKTRLRNVTRELRDMRDWCKNTGIPEKGAMSHTTYRKVMKVLHPDSQPDERARGEACRAFNAWIDSLKPARHPAS